jgi:hypothetical protein
MWRVSRLLTVGHMAGSRMVMAEQIVVNARDGAQTKGRKLQVSPQNGGLQMRLAAAFALDNIPEQQ